MFTASLAGAQTLTTIYAFSTLAQKNRDAAITFDATGTVLYGESYGDGANGYGTIFKLTAPPANGTSWTRSDLVSLDKNNRNAVGGLTLDKVSGSFFGVSQTGGPNVANDGQGNGTVFHLQTTGTAKVTTITAFDGYNGSDPVSPPTLDPSGNLIGGTFAGSYNYNSNAVTAGVNSGSTSGNGLIYNLTPPISGTTWTRTILIRVAGAPLKNPDGPLLQSASGDLYGVTRYGGPYNAGAVFKMHKTGSTWTAAPIYVFLPNGPGNVPYGNDGINPHGALVADQAGNLYGTTLTGGTHIPNSSGGTVFMLSPTQSGWKETILFNFGDVKDDGYTEIPTGGLVWVGGILYGTTSAGGFLGAGSLFSLTPPAAGQTTWTEKVLYTFAGDQFGAFPLGRLIADKVGNLYGATSIGGDPSCLCGTIFKYSPHG